MLAKNRANNSRIRRVICVILAMVMLISMGIVGLPPAAHVAYAVDPGGTTRFANAFSMRADPITSNRRFDRGLQSGYVWTDKSVSVDRAYIFDYLGQPATVQGGGPNVVTAAGPQANQFLVTLSALSQAVTTQANYLIPADTVFVIDVSGSMSGVDSGQTLRRIEILIDALNEAIEILLDANPDNRISVVAYGGAGSGNARVQRVLELGRYTRGGASNQFFALPSNIRVDAQVVGGSGGSINYSTFGVGGSTPTQWGIFEGSRVLETAANLTIQARSAADITQPAFDPDSGLAIMVTRVPNIILMTDGEPTMGWDNFHFPPAIANVLDSYRGPNGIPMSNAAAPTHGDGSRGETALALLTVLTAAHRRQVVENHYRIVAATDLSVNRDSLDIGFYTISLGPEGRELIDTAMQPFNRANPSAAYFADNAFPRSLNVGNLGGGYPSTAPNTSVGAILRTYAAGLPMPSGYTFLGQYREAFNQYRWNNARSTINLNNLVGAPALTLSELAYSDRYFAASDLTTLREAFRAITESINDSGTQYAVVDDPTNNFDGLITFSDVLGPHMRFAGWRGLWHQPANIPAANGYVFSDMTALTGTPITVPPAGFTGERFTISGLSASWIDPNIPINLDQLTFDVLTATATFAYYEEVGSGITRRLRQGEQIVRWTIPSTLIPSIAFDGAGVTPALPIRAIFAVELDQASVIADLNSTGGANLIVDNPINHFPQNYLTFVASRWLDFGGTYNNDSMAFFTPNLGFDFATWIQDSYHGGQILAVPKSMNRSVTYTYSTQYLFDISRNILINWLGNNGRLRIPTTEVAVTKYWGGDEDMSHWPTVYAQLRSNIASTVAPLSIPGRTAALVTQTNDLGAPVRVPWYNPVELIPSELMVNPTLAGLSHTSRVTWHSLPLYQGGTGGTPNWGLTPDSGGNVRHIIYTIAETNFNGDPIVPPANTSHIVVVQPEWMPGTDTWKPGALFNIAIPEGALMVLKWYRGLADNAVVPPLNIYIDAEWTPTWTATAGWGLPRTDTPPELPPFTIDNSRTEQITSGGYTNMIYLLEDRGSDPPDISSGRFSVQEIPVEVDYHAFVSASASAIVNGILSTTFTTEDIEFPAITPYGNLLLDPGNPDDGILVIFVNTYRPIPPPPPPIPPIPPRPPLVPPPPPAPWYPGGDGLPTIIPPAPVTPQTGVERNLILPIIAITLGAVAIVAAGFYVKLSKKSKKNNF
ncbi:MAG: VWA domain-containing protein [Oscillospiraceae bacterium]|nr:VWA domain-containing protein [Oscillospiraceae bacterium]